MTEQEQPQPDTGAIVARDQAQALARERMQAITLQDGGPSCSTLYDIDTLAATLQQSGMLPRGWNRQALTMAMLYARSVGLKEMDAAANVMIQDGKCSLYGDAPLALILRHPDYRGHQSEYAESESDGAVAIFRVYRKLPFQDEPVVFEGTFSMAEAVAAGLTRKEKTPWGSYPKRMLMWRAKQFALRDAFPDVVMGLVDEFADPMAQQEPVRITQEPSRSQPAADLVDEPNAQEIASRAANLAAKIAQRDRTESEDQEAAAAPVGEADEGAGAPGGDSPGGEQPDAGDGDPGDEPPVPDGDGGEPDPVEGDGAAPEQPAPKPAPVKKKTSTGRKLTPAQAKAIAAANKAAKQAGGMFDEGEPALDPDS